MIGEERLAENVPRNSRQLFLFLFNTGDLNFFFACDCLFRKFRVEQNITQQIDPGLQIRFHHMNADTHAVVAGVARDRSADGFDLIGDLLGSARLCAFEQNPSGQARDSIYLRSFSKQSAPENGAHRNQRQARIFPYQQTQTVGQLEFLNFRDRGRL